MIHSINFVSPMIMLSTDHQNHSKCPKWGHVCYTGYQVHVNQAPPVSGSKPGVGCHGRPCSYCHRSLRKRQDEDAEVRKQYMSESSAWQGIASNMLICLLGIAALGLDCIQEITDKVMNWVASCPKKEHDENQKRKLFVANRWALSTFLLSLLPFASDTAAIFSIFSFAGVQHVLRDYMMALMDDPLIFLINGLKIWVLEGKYRTLARAAELVSMAPGWGAWWSNTSTRVLLLSLGETEMLDKEREKKRVRNMTSGPRV